MKSREIRTHMEISKAKEEAEKIINHYDETQHEWKEVSENEITERWKGIDLNYDSAYSYNNSILFDFGDEGYILFISANKGETMAYLGPEFSSDEITYALDQLEKKGKKVWFDVIPTNKS